MFEGMLRDKQRPTIMLGMAGSLIAAGMRQVIVDLIEENMVDVVVSTGAIISQDFYQVRGGRHYHGHPDADDKELRDLYLDRLYDTLLTCTADSWTLRSLEGALLRGEYPPATFLGLKDLNAAVESGHSVHQAMPVTALARELYQLIDSKLGGLHGSNEVLRYYL